MAEYKQKGEGSYLLETQYGKRLIFDATRCYGQLGRYMKQSTKSPNCRYWCPLFVRGKSHIGFVATRDIEAEEEVVYDYGGSGIGLDVQNVPSSIPQGGLRREHRNVRALTWKMTGLLMTNYLHWSQKSHKVHFHCKYSVTVGAKGALGGQAFIHVGSFITRRSAHDMALMQLSRISCAHANIM